ncbi:probable inactive shikimate kinase like 2, chloroplastic isoform X2 [Ricinus communis]|uniref:probable inactive shikimate kinase like 2, chloroplastic isoform X2 n=1 Tax=Ricinus communis TaxID=3988 RepID=UPI00201A9471|nr:probable inactive shikimate kinase like 2, chloroplastic isoform X2 [Ricinus communis]
MATRVATVFSLFPNPIKTPLPQSSLLNLNFLISKPVFTSISKFCLPISSFKSYNVSASKEYNRLSCSCFSTATTSTNYEFSDGSSEVELRLPLGSQDYESGKDIFVDADGTSLIVRVKRSGSFTTLIQTNYLFDKIKPAETIWYIDDDQLVINLKKQVPELKWPDIVESWESLTAGAMQLLKGTSIYIVGDSTEINQKVARELAVGLGYTPLDTQELLETYTKQTIDSWVFAEGSDSVAEAESAILESLSSHVRAVISTLGRKKGAAGRSDRWRHLYAGFTVWLSQTEATDEGSAKEEARRHVQDGSLAYSKADVVVKVQGWNDDHAKSVAQASLSALKQLILPDKKLPGKKSLYIRLGCRGDWPNIKPPGWNPSAEGDATA